MAQFTVYRNANRRTRNTIPYLLDVQSDLLADLRTRVVIPLALSAHLNDRSMTTLTPTFELKGQTLVLLTPQLAGIPLQELGEPITDWTTHRDRIIAALDFLLTGI
ncbi:MAG: CcdB family protein [Gammaproteobacteria bacterium]|nr:CcdB family protein [Gammaproteobacteria bacterium]HRX69690.1 CcdB family protein [Candidatus Competibacteraceae bacterium]